MRNRKSGPGLICHLRMGAFYNSFRITTPDFSFFPCKAQPAFRTAHFLIGVLYCMSTWVYFFVAQTSSHFFLTPPDVACCSRGGNDSPFSTRRPFSVLLAPCPTLLFHRRRRLVEKAAPRALSRPSPYAESNAPERFLVPVR